MFLNGLLGISYALRVLVKCSDNSGSTQGHMAIPKCSTFESGRDIKLSNKSGVSSY